MVNPRTVNVGIIVPLTGADVDLWGEVDVNPNMVAVDGFIGGIQTVAISASPVTLTSPAGFTATPTPGPTQSQNRVLRFTGLLSGNVAVTLPLPGVYVIENLTTGNFVTQFRGLTVTEQICVEQGARQTIYNDGANVRFIDMPRVGSLEFWAGVTDVPSWVTNCTVRPFLRCDGSVYNFSDYPYLAAKMLGAFGGNGISTFGVPDLRGRYPLAYDGTGARVTVAVSGLNGQVMGAAGGTQGGNLAANQVPSLNSTGSNAITVGPPAPSLYYPGASALFTTVPVGSGTAAGPAFNPSGPTWNQLDRMVGNNNISVNYTNASQQPISNIPPTQVSGIWVIKT